MNEWVSPLSGNKTWSALVVPDWWHSGVGVGTGVGEASIADQLHPTRSSAVAMIIIRGNCFTLFTMGRKERGNSLSYRFVVNVTYFGSLAASG